MESTTRFIMTKLKLKVNQQESAVARPWEWKFLGFSFTNAGVPNRRIAPKAVDRFKQRVRELTQRTQGVSTERMSEELACYLPVWVGDSGKCEMPAVLHSLESGSGAVTNRLTGEQHSILNRLSTTCPDFPLMHGSVGVPRTFSQATTA